jgi:hypothetical protein
MFFHQEDVLVTEGIKGDALLENMLSNYISSSQVVTIDWPDLLSGRGLEQNEVYRSTLCEMKRKRGYFQQAARTNLNRDLKDERTICIDPTNAHLESWPTCRSEEPAYREKRAFRKVHALPLNRLPMITAKCRTHENPFC